MRATILAFAGFAAALFAVSACETMSAEDCATADWASLGYQDAANNGAERLAARAESCTAAQVTPDANAYRSGFENGMGAFCQPRNGFQFAASGRTFVGSCPAELDKDFRAAYFDGQEVRSAEQQAEESRSRVRTTEVAHRRHRPAAPRGSPRQRAADQRARRLAAPLARHAHRGDAPRAGRASCPV